MLCVGMLYNKYIFMSPRLPRVTFGMFLCVIFNVPFLYLEVPFPFLSLWLMNERIKFVVRIQFPVYCEHSSIELRKLKKCHIFFLFFVLRIYKPYLAQIYILGTSMSGVCKWTVVSIFRASSKTRSAKVSWNVEFSKFHFPICRHI